MAYKILIGDSPDDIARCLECKRPDCTNCLSMGPRRLNVLKKIRPIDCFDAETGELVAAYRSLSAAAKAIGKFPNAIANHCKSGEPLEGYIWKDHNPVRNV